MDFQQNFARSIRGMVLPALLAPTLADAKPAAKTKSPVAMPSAPISVMTYNVENLFDTEHDEGKDDWTYLPAARKIEDDFKKRCEVSTSNAHQMKECEELDWSETELKTKLDRIGKIVSSVNNGKCADILFLVEIENLKILERLRREFLGPCNYKPGILLEGEDKRGIDSAILSRFDRMAEPRLHPVEFVESRRNGEVPRSRGLLEASFKLPSGDILTAFAVHFPAPYHPFIERVEAMATLTKAARQAATQAHVVIAAGDFNVNAKEDSRLYRQIAAKDWMVSHLEGCRQCLGTHYFKKDDSWSFLDAIMVLQGGKVQPRYKWVMDPDSVTIVKGLSFQTNAEGIPLPWENAASPGQSDHLPLTLQLKPVMRK